MRQPFELDETVFHYEYGKGVITKIRAGFICMTFERIGLKSFTKEYANRILSYTPYDLVNGGFSDKKPLPKILQGTLVYVRHSDFVWEMRFFHSFDPDGRPRVFQNQKVDGCTITFREISLENPLI